MSLDLATIRSVSEEFRKKEDGAIAIIFGLSFVVLFFVLGMAIDYGRAVTVANKLAGAVDAAALAGAKGLVEQSMTPTQAKAVALAFFKNDIKGSSAGFATIPDPLIKVNPVTNAVTVTIDAVVPTTFARVGGFNSIPVSKTATVGFEPKSVEVGLALDNTGSMGDPSGSGGSKIDALKIAAKQLFDTLIPDTGPANAVKIGLAPFSAAVDAGSYATVATNGKTKTCVVERTGSDAYTDAAPGPGSYFHAGGFCPVATVVPLTNDKTVLKNEVDTFVAGGSTAGHIGIAWGWYLISPSWSSIWPAASAPVPYSDTSTQKVMVLMTDGMFNTQYFNPKNSAGQAQTLCTDMKAKGVTVYTILFRPDPAELVAAQTLLAKCASDANHFFLASDGAALSAAFHTIATKINNLRLTN